MRGAADQRRSNRSEGWRGTTATPHDSLQDTSWVPLGNPPWYPPPPGYSPGYPWGAPRGTPKVPPGPPLANCQMGYPGGPLGDPPGDPPGDLLGNPLGDPPGASLPWNTRARAKSCLFFLPRRLHDSAIPPCLKISPSNNAPGVRKHKPKHTLDTFKHV